MGKTIAKSVKAPRTKPTRQALSGDLESNSVVVQFEFNGETYQDVTESLSISGEDFDPEKVRSLLNRVPAKFAYWSNVLAEIETQRRSRELEFEFWYAEEYLPLVEQEAKTYPTEGARRFKIMTKEAVEFNRRTKEIDSLKSAQAKAETLVKSFEMQSKTLQTIASSLRAELSMLPS